MGIGVGVDMGAAVEGNHLDLDSIRLGHRCGQGMENELDLGCDSDSEHAPSSWLGCRPSCAVIDLYCRIIQLHVPGVDSNHPIHSIFGNVRDRSHWVIRGITEAAHQCIGV